MRSIWAGSISFGLVNIPIKLYSAAEEYELSLTMLHKKDSSPIRYAKFCKAEEKEIPYKEVVKGYEFQKGQYVVISDKDFEHANVSATHTIDIVEFTDEQELDLRYFEKPYYLEPEKSADKAYALLREALRQANKVAIATFVLRNREHLAVLKPVENAIVLNSMRFFSEVRSLKGLDLPDDGLIKKQEIDMAIALINQLSQKFIPKNFHDTYSEDLERTIQSKLLGKKIRVSAKISRPTQVKDLMATLKASLGKVQRSTARKKMRRKSA